MKRILVLALVSIISASCQAQQHPGAEEFAAKAAAEHELDQEKVLLLLQEARFKQSIVDAISRPAEAKPWYDYRPIFITDKRIKGGIEFWKENEKLIAQASEQFGVDPQFIVAIIGVETLYGRITGSYRVLDALTTLSFYYPDTGNDRSAFFSSELMNFFMLGDEERISLDDVTGSYAGAMGLGQFMPSSYREYAVDLDGDGRRDLWSSMADIIGSVANYLHRHGWEPGQPVTYPAIVSDDADMTLVTKRDYKPKKSVTEIAGGGFKSAEPVSGETLAAVAGLEEEDGYHYWLTFKNFYVITRYNRSPLYAMAVFELSEAILAGFED
ncbi:MAG: lytic murein transglycosylase B [Gammaproteobacteria bacterium]|jgi:membrane-bound lytic murein transglycosylase B|nr:lytic murein transglycosylase B [Gammaproteobacteria bacterium]